MMSNENPSKSHRKRKSHNWLVYRIGDKFLNKHVPLYKGILYDLGCGEAPYKDFFLQYCSEYVGVDWAKSYHHTKADIIADLNKSLPIESEIADTVISLSVLEHLCEPQTMLNEACRILKPGGAIIAQVPWQWWVHEAPYDYFRYTPYGLKYLFDKAGFKDIVVESQSGFFTMWLMKLNYFSIRLIRGPKRLRLVVGSLLSPFWHAGQLAAPLLDRLDRNWALDSFAYVVTARKPVALPHRKVVRTDVYSQTTNNTFNKEQLIRQEQLKIELYSNIIKEAKTNFGVTDLNYLMNVTNNWFEDSRNYDGRWAFIAKRSVVGKVLDMAAGCGTFLLYGLKNGNDVWGVEPERWKLDYFRKKISVSGYPSDYKNRMVPSVGEALPFKSKTFDLVSTYQTLEHVDVVRLCLEEMLRVLKPGGSLFIRAPDYSGFFEGHYRLFFLPKMPGSLARLYLKLRGRPITGLSMLKYVTKGQLVRILQTCGQQVSIEEIDEERRKQKLLRSYPILEVHPKATRVLVDLLKFAYNISCMFSRRDKAIALWITKYGKEFQS